MALFIDSTEILPTYDIVIGGTHLKQIDVVKGSNPPVTVWRSSYTFTVTTTNEFYGGLAIKVNGTTVKTITTATTEEIEVLPGSSVVLSYQGSNWYSKTINADISVSATNSYTIVSISHGDYYSSVGSAPVYFTTNRPITVSAYEETWMIRNTGDSHSTTMTNVSSSIAAGTHKYADVVPSGLDSNYFSGDAMRVLLINIPGVVVATYSGLAPHDRPVNPTYTAGTVTVTEV
jgi:hypothetical protein